MSDTTVEPIVAEHFDKAAKYVGLQRERIFRSYAQIMLVGSRHMRSIIESPLEMLFLLWFAAVQETTSKYHDFNAVPQSQVVLGGRSYRVDFQIVPLPDNAGDAAIAGWHHIAVEVDGHAFHERTKEQVQTRDSRDRALLAAGWRVFHFSFSEFTGDPVGCITEVLEFAFTQRYST